MKGRKRPDPIEEYLKAEGFFYKEKARREEEKGRGRIPKKTVKYDRKARNRRIVYMDLIIILIMMGVIIPFAQNFLNVKKEDYYGYKLDWDYNFGKDRVYHSLTIEAPPLEEEDHPTIIEVRFMATGGEEIVISDLLPSPGQTREITGEIPLEELPDYVSCTARLGDMERSWKVYTGKVRYLPRLKRPD
ncbi:MAG: hypothetical protein PQJ59_08695 [Spirochaetales bacterium]|nr:hypothetical protein [Spirochaetales bacterium]